ncbi:MAG: helix-turn-helix transcriptional regulator [Geobacter sp.]|nr:MAG: helix-turn-helix transcriptional regulator [Geobacter sp.]
MIEKFLKMLSEKGWTQKQIEEKTGIPQTMISRYTRGKSCTVENLVKIAKAFDVSTDEVLGLDQQRPYGNSRRDRKPKPDLKPL